MVDTILLDLERLSKNPDNKVRIQIGGGSSDGINNLVTGFLASNLRLSGSNTWNTPFDNDITSSLNDAVNKAVAGANNTGYFNISNFMIKTELQTVLNWTSSDRFRFSVSLLFLSFTRKDNNVLQPLRTLLSSVNPLSVGNASLQTLGNFFQGIDNFNIETIAPRGYSTQVVNGLPVGLGTSVCEVGRWFLADKLCIDSIDFDIDKTPRDDGKPLFATATVNFQTFKMLSEAEVLKFIRDPK